MTLSRFYTTFSVDGGWSTWHSWSRCSASCGGGVRIRVRSCTNPRPAYGGRSCPGNETESHSCHDAPCPGKEYTIFLASNFNDNYVCICLLLNVSVENISLVTRHHWQGGLRNLGIYSAPKASKQGGIFIVSNLLWHVTLFLPSHIKGFLNVSPPPPSDQDPRGTWIKLYTFF